jgi:multiple sugar transport system substrate-binding protein
MRSLLLLLGMLLGGVAAAAPPVTVRYMLWDSLQMPAYRECAADFTQRNPGITIKIAQAGWDDYWTALSVTPSSRPTACWKT